MRGYFVLIFGGFAWVAVAATSASPERNVLEQLISSSRQRLENRAPDVGAVCNGRLTVTTGTPISTANVTGATTLYFTPYGGNKIALYDGSVWKLFTFTERSLALGTLLSGYNYDVFIYDNGGTATLELSSAWNVDGLTRTDAISSQNGIYVKTGTPTRRFVGTIRTTSTTQTEDSLSRRFVWNQCQQVPRLMVGNMTPASWSYANPNSWHPSGGNTTDGESRVAFVQGRPGPVLAAAYQLAEASNSLYPNISIGINSIAVSSASAVDGPAKLSFRHGIHAVYNGALDAGYYYLQTLEIATGGGATANTYYGTGSGGPFHSISARIQG